jgi:UDP-glucose 4-epimerase
MNNILVTGGYGFLGGHLVETLLAEPENRVFVLDDLSRKHSVTELLGLMQVLPGEPRFAQMSIQQFLAGADIRGHWYHKYGPFQEIYHLASPVGPVGLLDGGGTIASRIVADTLDLALMAHEDGARLLFVSTSETYGGGVAGECAETMPCRIPIHPSPRLEYALGKLAAEVALVNRAARIGLHTTIVRPFNIAGPRQSPVGGFALPRFITQALAGDPLTVFGDGTAVRAFTHVLDIVDGMRLVMERGRSGAVYNLGRPENKITIRALAGRVIAATRSDSVIEHVNPQDLFGPDYAEANDKFPDIAKAKEDLGYNPMRTLDQVIADTIAYWKGEAIG